MKILVAYDGTLQSKKALRYGIEKIREKRGVVIVLHVFQGSLFIDYDATPGAEEIARKESSKCLEDARQIIKEAGNGVRVKIIEEEGHPEEEIVKYAESENADIILSTPRYRKKLKNAHCPVSIIPGNILVPVDNTDSVMTVIDLVVKEARSTDSKVILAGIVPIHIYGKWEKKEIEAIKKETSLRVKKSAKLLSDYGIESKQILRSGYPDEELLKIADEYGIAMIVIPEAGGSPSEISKAGAIISEKCGQLGSAPLILVPTP
jgi:nucleotide-binding universal stress UspA family protein